MVIVLLEYIDLFLRLAVLQVRIFSILKIIIPIMLALCLMLSGTYYAKNYAGIIGRGLIEQLHVTSQVRRSTKMCGKTRDVCTGKGAF